MTEPERRPARGCLFYGTIIGGLILAVIIVAAYLGFRFAAGVADQFTDPQPATLPTVELSELEWSRLDERLAAFREAVQSEQPAESLTLTAKEVNALISTNPAARALKDKIFVMIEGDQLRAQLSIPAEEIGIELLKGRFVNATGTFTIGVLSNELRLQAEQLEAKGKPLSETVMRQLRGRNWAANLNNDPSVKRGVAKIEEVQVKDGKLVIVPKK